MAVCTPAYVELICFAVLGFGSSLSTMPTARLQEPSLVVLVRMKLSEIAAMKNERRDVSKSSHPMYFEQNDLMIAGGMYPKNLARGGWVMLERAQMDHFHPLLVLVS